MKKIAFFLIVLCSTMLSCTKEKTHYEGWEDLEGNKQEVFIEAYAFTKDKYRVCIKSINGLFAKGYNPVHLEITDQETGNAVAAHNVSLLPVMTNDKGERISCIHPFELNPGQDEPYFSGYALFPQESKEGVVWELYVDFFINGQDYRAKLQVYIEQQQNKNLNMTAFKGQDGESYFIALAEPGQPKVGENILIAGIYQYIPLVDGLPKDFPEMDILYQEVGDYTLKIDPRMPEPSMGNHSSPNNSDLIQQGDNLYHGLVNYTMTGNWTLNLILLDKAGNVIKGTKVPPDFTPGEEGVKSTLYIDVLF